MRALHPKWRHKAADGTSIPNQQRVRFRNDEGHVCDMGLQISDVERPRAAVSQMAATGNRVTFKAQGGMHVGGLASSLTPYLMNLQKLVRDLMAASSEFRKEKLVCSPACRRKGLIGSVRQITRVRSEAACGEQEGGCASPPGARRACVQGRQD